MTYVAVHSQPVSAPIPGRRGFAGVEDEPVPLETGEDEPVYYVDELMTNGAVRLAGQFVRLDTAYGYGHIMARTRARMVRSGQSALGVLAVIAADTVYVIAELVADELSPVRLVAALKDAPLRSEAIRLAREVTGQPSQAR